MGKKKKKVNPHCPVDGCRATNPHVADPTVNALMRAFGAPAEMTKWTFVAMSELAESICRDLENKKTFAFVTRVRQPEEMYIRTLYALFVVTDKELPHILSGEMPNGLSRLYEKVNSLVFEGRGLLNVSYPGLSYGTFKPIDALNDGAHVSFRSFLTCIGWGLNPENIPNPEGYRQHMRTYCSYLEYMHGMFSAGRTKADVLAAVRKIHKPASARQEKIPIP